jgi:uncharacterized protein YbcI
MTHSHVSIGQKIARAARAFENRRTKHGHKWVAVFMNENTVVIALHGSLTSAESALSQSPLGAAQVREFHRLLVATASETLIQKIERITGTVVRDTGAEIEPTTGSVVHLFTTDTVGEKFLCAPVQIGRNQLRRTRAYVAPAKNPTKPNVVIRG